MEDSNIVYSLEGHPLVQWIPDSETGIVGPHYAEVTQGFAFIVDTGQHLYFRIRGRRLSIALSVNHTAAFSPENENTTKYYELRLNSRHSAPASREWIDFVVAHIVNDYLLHG